MQIENTSYENLRNEKTKSFMPAAPVTNTVIGSFSSLRRPNMYLTILQNKITQSKTRRIFLRNV